MNDDEREKEVTRDKGILILMWRRGADHSKYERMTDAAVRRLPPPPERTESGRITRPPSLPGPPFRAVTLEGELAAYLGLEPLLTLLRADVTAEHTGEFRPAHAG